jgi:hypothetical protein
MEGMHLDDTPIKIITEILVLGKLVKELVCSKTARHIGASLFKKISSVPRGISFFKKSESRLRPVEIMVFQKNRNRLTHIPCVFPALQKKLA